MKKIIITFSVIIAVIILIIGFIIHNNNNNIIINEEPEPNKIIDLNSEEGIEYSIKILDYLKNKYGSNNEFEILDLEKEIHRIYGDGHAMGTDRKPVCIDSIIMIKANVISKTNNISFEAYITWNEIGGYHYDDNLK